MVKIKSKERKVDDQNAPMEEYVANISRACFSQVLKQPAFRSRLAKNQCTKSKAY